MQPKNTRLFRDHIWVEDDTAAAQVLMKVIRPSCCSAERSRALLMTKSLGPAARLRQHFSVFFCNGFSLVCFYDHCFSHSVLQRLFLLVVFSSKVAVLFHQVVLCSSDNHVNSLKTRVSSSNSNWRVKTILFWPREAGAISETCRLHLSVCLTAQL